MPDREIKLIQKEGRLDWQVHFGERYDYQLSWDEALGVVASILLGNQARYLRTLEQWREYERKIGHAVPEAHRGPFALMRQSVS